MIVLLHGSLVQGRSAGLGFLRRFALPTWSAEGFRGLRQERLCELSVAMRWADSLTCDPCSVRRNATENDYFLELWFLMSCDFKPRAKIPGASSGDAPCAAGGLGGLSSEEASAGECVSFRVCRARSSDLSGAGPLNLTCHDWDGAPKAVSVETRIVLLCFTPWPVRDVATTCTGGGHFCIGR